MSKTRTTRSTKSKKSSRAVQSMTSAVVGIAANESSPSDVVVPSMLALVVPQESVAPASSNEVVAAAPTNELVEVAAPTPSHDDVARRAYEIFLRRGGASGHPLADWLQAERELGVVRAA
jgi:hypothetical protein